MAAHSARWTVFILIISLVTDPWFLETTPRSQPKFQEQALATWATSFRTLLSRQDKSPFQSRLLSKKPLRESHSVENATEYAHLLHGEDKDPLSQLYIPGSWQELDASVKLMNFPLEPLLDKFNRASPGEKDYNLIVTALGKNYNLSFIPRIRAAYESEFDRQKKSDLADVLLHIQYNAILVSRINRRTWKDRYAAMDERFLQAVRLELKKYPNGILIIDWAVSNGMTTLRRARLLEKEGLLNGVRMVGYDKVMDFRILTQNGSTFVFNSEGKLIQRRTADGRLWIRWSLAQYLPAPMRWLFYWIMKHEGNVDVGEISMRMEIADAEKNLSRHSESISLLDPEAEAWAREHPQNLQFAYDDITAPSPTERPHLILMTGMAMRPEKHTWRELLGLLSKPENYSLTRLMRMFFFGKTASYFKKEEVRALLVQHGRLLQEGGMLFNGIDVPPHLYLDVYEKKGNTLVRLPQPQWSEGYANSEGWEVIDLSEEHSSLNRGFPALKRAG